MELSKKRYSLKPRTDTIIPYGTSIIACCEQRQTKTLGACLPCRVDSDKWRRLVQGLRHPGREGRGSFAEERDGGTARRHQ